MLMLSACDIIDNPVVPFNSYETDLYGEPPVFDPAIQSLKNVLVEDFTGHQCGNCPVAAVIAEALAEANPENVFPLAIHAGSYALTSIDYPTDWTCEEGYDLFNQLAFQANPLGRVNRKGGTENYLAPTEWGEVVEEELALSCPLTVQVQHSWELENGHLNIHVNGQFFGPFAGNNRLSVLITESGLIGDQLDYESNPSHVEYYEFNHLLRGSVSGAHGLVVISDAETGNSFQSDFTINWNNEWIPENSSLIAVVSNEDGYVVTCLGHHLGE
jgi:hypothetical protein